MNKISLAKLGSKNPMWKGDKVSYGALHDYIKSWKTKPTKCEKCHKKKLLDLTNKSGKYLRHLSDWEWLCRKCHMDSDGRNEQMRKNGKSRRLPDRICQICKTEFHKTYGMKKAKYCSMECRDKSMLGKITNKYGKNQYKK